jgi:hypothetical protein
MLIKTLFGKVSGAFPPKLNSLQVISKHIHQAFSDDKNYKSNILVWFSKISLNLHQILLAQSATNYKPRWQHKDNTRNSTTDFKNTLRSQGLKGK